MHYNPQEQDENDDHVHDITRDPAGNVLTVKGHTAGYWLEMIAAERDFIKEYRKEYRRIMRYNVQGRSDEAQARIQACEWNIEEYSAYVAMFE